MRYGDRQTDMLIAILHTPTRGVKLDGTRYSAYLRHNEIGTAWQRHYWRAAATSA